MHGPERPSPSFETDNFTITYLSASPQGFDLISEEPLGKTEGENGEFSLSADERDQLKTAMQDEMRFQGASKLREQRTAWRTALVEDPESESTAYLEQAFRAARQDYHERGKKIGLRALRLIDGNTLTARPKIVHFPTYEQLATSSARSEMHDFADVTTISMAIRTSDKRLLVQHRAITKPRITQPGVLQGNGLYADVPGASVAGHLDAKMRTTERKPGEPDPVDKSYIFQAIAKEVEEELGLHADQLENMRIAGMATNNVKPHDEFLLLAESKLTAAQVKEASRASTLNKDLGDADFNEKFVDIEGSPEAIQTLLTRVRCPLPPTHVAGLVAAGYSITLAERGQGAAEAWKSELQNQVTDNYRAIDATVASYYRRHPEAYMQVPERYWGKKNIPPRNREAYTPAYGPEEQGLPSFTDEMVRNGLLPETRRHVESSYLMDVDGVITDPVEKRITNEGILDALAAKLNAKDPVGLNTGRSTKWIIENVLEPLIQRLDDVAVLKNLIIIGEKGGTWVTFDEKGSAHHGAAPKLTIPADLHEKILSLVEAKYGDSMFVDPDKETMISVEMHTGHDLADFHQKREAFAQDAQKLLNKEALVDWQIDPTTIATDLESVHAGTDLGADRFLDFLKAQNIVVRRIKAFGDSSSDTAMSEELVRRGYATEFIYVGSGAGPTTTKTYTIHHYGNYTDGTAQALREL